MVAIPERRDPTLDAVRKAMEEAERQATPRGYLGMSSIADPCARRLWYSFRLVGAEPFDAKTIGMFQDGHRTEDLMAERLMATPELSMDVVDPKTGGQFEFVDHSGHFRGHSDGMNLVGLLQAPKVSHVWEHKASADYKGFLRLKKKFSEKNVLKEWSPTYYGQATCYMGYSGHTRHYLTVSTPGGREFDAVRTDYDEGFFKQLRQRAFEIITAKSPPLRVSEKPNYYHCKNFCKFTSICHSTKMPKANCRTCSHSTPEMDGNARWSCSRFNIDLEFENQVKGCRDHVYIPALLDRWGAVSDSSPGLNIIYYQMADGRQFSNGSPLPPGVDSGAAHHYTSHELQNMTPELVGDPVVAGLRSGFGARVESVE